MPIAECFVWMACACLMILFDVICLSGVNDVAVQALALLGIIVISIALGMNATLWVVKT